MEHPECGFTAYCENGRFAMAPDMEMKSTTESLHFKKRIAPLGCTHWHRIHST